jgi:hypothetical protein
MALNPTAHIHSQPRSARKRSPAANARLALNAKTTMAIGGVKNMAMTNRTTTCAGSVAQRWLGARATNGNAFTGGRKPIGRFFTCQPLSWKMRRTVFLLKSNRCATVR